MAENKHLWIELIKKMVYKKYCKKKEDNTDNEHWNAKECKEDGNKEECNDNNWNDKECKKEFNVTTDEKGELSSYSKSEEDNCKSVYGETTKIVIGLQLKEYIRNHEPRISKKCKAGGVC